MVHFFYSYQLEISAIFKMSILSNIFYEIVYLYIFLFEWPKNGLKMLFMSIFNVSNNV